MTLEEMRCRGSFEAGPWQCMGHRASVCVCARPANHNIQPPNLQHRCRPTNHSFPRRRSFPSTHTASDASCLANSDTIASHLDRDCLTATRPSTPTRTATLHHHGRSQQGTRHRLSRMGSRGAPSVQRSRRAGARGFWLLSAQ
jgi:hypothetical protein